MITCQAFDQGSHTLVCHHLPGFFYYINFDSYDIAEQLVLIFVFDIPMDCHLSTAFNDRALWYLTALISVIPWRSVLMMQETRVPTENHQPATSH